MSLEAIANKLNKLSHSSVSTYLSTLSDQTLHSLKEYLDNLYYNTGESFLDDTRYDMFKDFLIEKGFKPAVGSKLREGDNRKQLPFWLGSVDKVTPDQPDGLTRWLTKNKANKYLVSAKLDGVSCLLVYKKNKLYLYTRGDGIVGADISYLSKYLNLPELKEDISIRGELIMKKDVFSQSYSETYRNPRNMVAGLIGGKTLRKGINDINFVTYEIVGEHTMPSPENQLIALKNLGFKVVKYKMMKDINIDSLILILLDFKKTYKFEIDGIIIQPNIMYDRNTSDNPEYMLAFKMNLEENIVETMVQEVEWKISRWGQLKPVVIFDPIDLSGVTISRATAHNAKYIVDNEIGPGTLIRITRSKEVIPYIVEVVKGTSASMPKNFIWDKTNTNILVEKNDSTCDNEICIKVLTNFFEKLNIKQVSSATVKKMYESGLNTLFKILEADEERLSEIPTFKEKTVKRVYDNIHAGLQNVKLPLLLSASSVFGFGVGTKRLEVLFQYYPDLLDDKRSREELIVKVSKVEGFSEIMACKIVDNLKYARLFMKKIKKYISITKDTRVSNDLIGKKFVFSGFRDVSLQDEIKNRGGTVTDSVSKNTSGIVVNSKNGQETTKVKKARDIGIPIYTKEEFMKKIIRG